MTGQVARSDPAERKGQGQSPVLALMLGWLLPGAGHAYAGRWGKATLFFVLIVGLLVGGFVMGGGTNIRKGELWWVAQICAGGPTVVLTFVSYYLEQRWGIDWKDPLREMGTLYTAVAGFLNLLVMMDAYIKLAYPHESAVEEKA